MTQVHAYKRGTYHHHAQQQDVEMKEPEQNNVGASMLEQPKS